MKTSQEEFREIQEKSKKISEGAIQINTKIEAARESHQKLAALAKEKFGTSDIEELAAMLEAWDKENTEAVQKYADQVNSLEKEVNEKSSLIKQIQQSAA
jgi:uncharacterized protein Yka (UPF0111/DUF47 family)